MRARRHFYFDDERTEGRAKVARERKGDKGEERRQGREQEAKETMKRKRGRRKERGKDITNGVGTGGDEGRGKKREMRERKDTTGKH